MSTIKVNALQDTSGNGYYPARAWVTFNGEGTVAIRDDGNVSSITDNGTGNYTTTFGSSFSSSDYATVGSAGISVGTRIFTGQNTPATGSRVVEITNESDAARDVPYVYAVFTL